MNSKQFQYYFTYIKNYIYILIFNNIKLKTLDIFFKNKKIKFYIFKCN